MGRILSLNGRPSDTVEIRMRVSQDLAAHIASQRQTAEAAIRDLGVALSHVMELAGITCFRMDLETLRNALPQAAKLKRVFDKDGGMTVSFWGSDAPAEGDKDVSNSNGADPSADIDPRGGTAH